MDLNPEQLKAVQHNEGPLLILAGAGTGKTRVITHRIARLIRENIVAPWNVLAVTFTNKAAEEMRTRVAALFSERSSGLPGDRERGSGGWGPEGAAITPNIWISTFHSSCLRMLRRSLPPGRNQFVIYDDDDTQTLVKRCLEELKIDDRSLSPRAVSARIAGAKNELITPELYLSKTQDYIETRVAEIYALYQRKLGENNAMDFGDLIFKAVTMLQSQPELLARYQDLFRYIMIDEYQDTNRAQYVLTRLLAGSHKNLCVVGDDDQSIYRWRGADIQNILNFEADYPGSLVIRLEQNYRSTQTILSIANRVIAKNAGRKGKSLWTQGAPGDKAVVYTARDERDEARFVVEEIQRRGHQEGRRFNDFAIFYRTNAQSRTFEDELLRHRIPYMIFGGMKFYERREIKDMLAYLRVLVNPQDSINLKRILNVPTRGIGGKAEERLEAFASEREIPLYAALGKASEIVELNTGAKKKILEFHQTMEKLRSEMRALPGVAKILERIIHETGYEEMLREEKTVEAEGRLENLEELLNVASEFEKTIEGGASPEGPAMFLDQVSLVGDTDTLDPAKGSVLLMTLHLAKGLEFPSVFLVGMEEGLFPHSRSLDEIAEMEEERRLCYVGVTRARKGLTLTLAARRRLYGGDQFNLPSRFLDEMPAEFLERHWGSEESGMGAGRRKPPFYDDDHDFEFDQSAPEETSAMKNGAVVTHPTFGIGVVKKREGQGEGEKVTVYFKNGQIKTLVVKFANLEVVSKPK